MIDALLNFDTSQRIGAPDKGENADIEVPEDDKFFNVSELPFERSLPAEIPSLNKEYKNLITTWYLDP